MMKTNVKLTLCSIVAVVLPMTVFSSFAASRYTETASELQIATIKNAVSDKADYLNEVFRDITGDLKEFTMDGEVIKYTLECSSNGYDGTWNDAEYVNERVQHAVKNNQDIIDMFVLDNRGTVIAAKDENDIGTPKDDILAELEESAAHVNGISRIYAPETDSGNYYYAVRRIYSDENEPVGMVCQKFESKRIFDSIKIQGVGNYIEVMIIDSDGKYVKSGVSIPKKLNAVAEYSGFSERLKNVVPYYAGESLSYDVACAEYNGSTVCGKVISNAGWCIAAVLDNDTAVKQYSVKFSPVKVMGIFLTAAGVVAVIFFSAYFTRNLGRILSVLKKGNRGDYSVRLDLKSKDEFGEMSAAFNSMLDNVFESDQRYRTVVSMMDNIIFEVNLKTNKVFVSNNFNQKFAFRPEDDSLEESFLKRMKVHKDDISLFNDDVDRFITTKNDKWEGEYRLRNIYGDFSWIRIRGRKFFDRAGAASKIIGMMVDIDREKKSTMNLMQKANFDALTQLYNRASFLKKLDDEMQLSVARRSLDALMFIDLDDFKHFNDEYGHKCGDEVLKFVADTIKELTFDAGFGGRLGGDEFVMCLTNLKLIGDAGKIAEEMIQILGDGFVSESTGLKLNIHCSIGIAFFRENGGNSTELLESADTAMYRIKKSGKSNYSYAGKEETPADNDEKTEKPEAPEKDDQNAGKDTKEDAKKSDKASEPVETDKK